MPISDRIRLFLCFVGLLWTIAPAAMAQAKPCGIIGAATLNPLIDPAQVDDKFPSSAADEEYRRYVRGGANIRVLIETDSATGIRPLTITLLSKSLDAAGWNRPFQERCSSRLTKAAEVIGQDEKGGATSTLWMIRISPIIPGAGLQTLRIRVWGIDVSMQSASQGIGAMLGIVPELACQAGTRTRYQSGNQGQAPFATRVMLSVAVDDKEVPLQNSVKQELGLYITEALATWNTACFNCATNNLLLIKVGQDLYLNSILASGYRQAARSGLSPSVLIDLDIDIALMRRNASASGVPYEFLQKDDPAIGAICSSHQGWRDPRMRVVRNGLACPAPGDKVLATDVSEVTIKLLKGLTNCLNNGKRDPNIIACEKNNLVEFDTEDFAFVSHQSEETFFRKGNRPVDLLRVIAHEVGHWIGLGHLQPGIVAANFQDADCINDAVVDRLVGALQSKRPKQWSSLTYR